MQLYITLDENLKNKMLFITLKTATAKKSWSWYKRHMITKIAGGLKRNCTLARIEFDTQSKLNRSRCST